jgi:SWI/SNF-related matrix-associated actin-dependent regulator 1 of chromatin subfamily A
MSLRKAALHPLLFRELYSDPMVLKVSRSLIKEQEYWDANPEHLYEDLLVYSDFELHSLCSRFKATKIHALKSNEWMESAKVKVLAHELAEAKQRGDRCLVFSQFTMCMDILENCLQTLNHVGCSSEFIVPNSVLLTFEIRDIFVWMVPPK